MKPGNLQFSKLECYQEFLRNPKHVGKSGVYVWGFRFVDPGTGNATEFKPYYAGKSEGNVHKRIQEHVHNIRNGTAAIMFEGILREEIWYRKVDVTDSTKFAYSNLLLRKETSAQNSPKSSLAPMTLLTLSPHINAYIDNLYVTYLAVDPTAFANAKDHAGFIYQLERLVQDKLGNRCISALTGSCQGSFAEAVRISTGPGTEYLQPLFD